MGLWPFKRPSAGTEAGTAADPSALRIVYRSYSPVEAHVVGGMLEGAGIECVYGNELIAAVESPISNVTGGVQVLVRAADVEKAHEIIQSRAFEDA